MKHEKTFYHLRCTFHISLSGYAGNASTSLRGPSGNPANGLSEEGANKPSVALKEASSSSGVSSGTKLQPGRNQDVGKKPLIKAPAKAIVVPIVLRMADIDHQVTTFQATSNFNS